jgi:hypothetical protein
MNLASADFHELNRSTFFLSIGKRLAQEIDTPSESKYVFQQLLHGEKESFPALVGAFARSKTALYKRSKKARLDLKEALLQDVRANLAAVSAQVTGAKQLFDGPLPSDPVECIARLDQMAQALHDQICDVQSNLGSVRHARDYMELIQDQQRKLEAFNEADYTAETQEASQRPLQKKPKRG